MKGDTITRVLVFVLITVMSVGCFESEPKEPPSPPPTETSSAPQTPELTPLQLYLDVSQLRISLKTMHDQFFLNYFKLETGKPTLPPSLVSPVRNYIIESVHRNSLLDRFVSELGPHVSDSELQQMNAWLSSPLGAKVNALEMGQFTNPNFTAPRIKYNTLPEARQKLIGDYVDFNRLVAITVNTLRLAKFDVLQGIQSVSDNNTPVKAPEITANDRAFARLQLLDHYSGLFRNLTDLELEQLVKIIQNSTYHKVHLSTNRALIVSFEASARDIGRIIGQGLRQIQHEEASVAKEAEEEKPPERPKLKESVEMLRKATEETNKRSDRK